MYELTKIDYMKVSNLINNLNGGYIFAYAVLENIQSGHIYVDNINNPNCCLIVSNGGKYLVAGDEENLNFRDILSLFLKNPNNHSNYFDLYVSSEKWLKIISGLLEDHVVKLGRSIYCYLVLLLLIVV